MNDHPCLFLWLHSLFPMKCTVLEIMNLGIDILKKIWLFCKRNINLKMRKTMKKTAIVYGSTTGTTKFVAHRIAGKLGIPEADIYDIGLIGKGQLTDYDILILGTSTWGCGELQDDWYSGMELLKAMNLEDKTIALFGCGDCESYADTFCDAMGLIYRELERVGGLFVGAVPVADYHFASSLAVVDGHFVGLAIDDINEPEKTDARIESWVSCIKEAEL